MLTKEEIAEIMIYCKENSVTYRQRLNELGIPSWKFYDNRARLARKQELLPESSGSFIQLSEGTFVTEPDFKSSRMRSASARPAGRQSGKLDIEISGSGDLRMQIRGEVNCDQLRCIIETLRG